MKLDEVGSKTSIDKDDVDNDDPLYNDIVEFVISTRKASASLLQRRFKLGYNRAARIIDLLEERGIKVELDTRAEKIGYKIREANGKYKIPVQLVLGKAEIENRTVNVRRFGSQDQTSMSLDEFLKMVEEENKVKF